MESLRILQSKGFLKNANSYILTNREKKELIDAFYSLAKINKIQLGYFKANMVADSECQKRLCPKNINSRSDFRKWASENHPDKGGDLNIFQHVTECVNENIFCNSDLQKIQENTDKAIEELENIYNNFLDEFDNYASSNDNPNTYEFLNYIASLKNNDYILVVESINKGKIIHNYENINEDQLQEAGINLLENTKLEYDNRLKLNKREEETFFGPPPLHKKNKDYSFEIFGKPITKDEAETFFGQPPLHKKNKNKSFNPFEKK